MWGGGLTARFYQPIAIKKNIQGPSNQPPLDLIASCSRWWWNFNFVLFSPRSLEIMIQFANIGNKWAETTKLVTLQEINISHLGKRKIIFKYALSRDMLIPWRVFSCGRNSSHENQFAHVVRWVW